MEYGIISPIKIKVELIIIFKILLQCFFFFLIVYSQAPNNYERPICHHANKTLNWKLKLNWERGGLKKEDVRERSRIFKHRCVVVGGHWTTFISPPIRRERLQAEPESLWGALARSLSLSLSLSISLPSDESVSFPAGSLAAADWYSKAVRSERTKH